MHSSIVCSVPVLQPLVSLILPTSQPIRPMPRAYDQIVAILVRFKVVRDNLNTLNASLQQVIILSTLIYLLYHFPNVI